METGELSIDSRDGRFRVTLRETAEGISYRLLRHSGTQDLRGAGVRIVWSQIECGVIGAPLHVVRDRLHGLVWPLADDRRRTIARRPR